MSTLRSLTCADPGLGPPLRNPPEPEEPAVTLHENLTRNRRFHRSPRKALRVLRQMHADRLTEQRGAYRNQRRQARADRKAEQS